MKYFVCYLKIVNKENWSKKTSVLLDMGASNIKMIIVHNGYPAFQQIINQSSQRIDLLIANALNIERDEAERYKIKIGLKHQNDSLEHTERSISSIRVSCTSSLNSTVVRTGMYPILGSDYQQPLTPLLLRAEGTSIIQDRVFPERFQHAYQLNRMGARIAVNNGTAAIEGKARLMGTWVKASDIRAGSCLILAGLMAEGATRITGVEHIERGYENIVRDFRQLGADISLFE
jgi:UDP-N-acetylglucosamine enolpyruvyl transferase